MATALFRRFSRPKFLRSISPDSLRALLEPYQGYLKERGVDLAAAALDYQHLATVLATPTEQTPGKMVQALCVIEELASRESTDDLPDATGRSYGGRSPGDLYVEMWVNDPERAERLHRQNHFENLRSFNVLAPRSAARPWTTSPDHERLESLERALAEHFQRRHYGRFVRVLVIPMDGQTTFFVLRGDTYRREECIGSQRSDAVAFRPAKYDLLVYDLRSSELQLNVRSPALRKMYGREFGDRLFDDEDHFREAPRYTLEPLRRDGVAALACQDVKGIEWVRLRSVDLEWDGETKFSMTMRAADLMHHWAVHRHHFIAPNAKITAARFDVKFCDCRRPRRIEVVAPFRVKFKRDHDPMLVELWLSSRGYRTNVGRTSLAGA